MNSEFRRKHSIALSLYFNAASEQSVPEAQESLRKRGGSPARTPGSCQTPTHLTLLITTKLELLFLDQLLYTLYTF
jgi:hypothetical protein